MNVVDLMRLQDPPHHPHGLPDAAFDAIFTATAPVVFAFHGYPSLIHQLTYRRTNHANIHVRGFVERGTTTTPFDMLHLNDLDRYRLALDVLTGCRARRRAPASPRSPTNGTRPGPPPASTPTSTARIPTGSRLAVRRLTGVAASRIRDAAGARSPVRPRGSLPV